MAPNLANDTTTLWSLSFLFTNASTPRRTQHVRKLATSPSNRQVVQVIPVCVYWFRVCAMNHCNHVHIIVCRCEAQDLEHAEARNAQGCLVRLMLMHADTEAYTNYNRNKYYYLSMSSSNSDDS